MDGGIGISPLHLLVLRSKIALVDIIWPYLQWEEISDHIANNITSPLHFFVFSSNMAFVDIILPYLQKRKIKCNKLN